MEEDQKKNIKTANLSPENKRKILIDTTNIPSGAICL